MRSLQRNHAGLKYWALFCFVLFSQKLCTWAPEVVGSLEQSLGKRQEGAREQETGSAEALHACSDSLHLMQEAVELRQG